MSRDSHSMTAGNTSTPVSPADLPPDRIDRKSLLEIVDQDEGLLKQLARLFLADKPRLMAEIQDSVTRGDCAKLDGAAHTLKGSVGNFGARRAAQLAARLEKMGREKNLQGAAEAFAALDKEIARVSAALAEFSR
jgi:HPt (histidine-containing phosphotransfer) domain-containing protein